MTGPRVTPVPDETEFEQWKTQRTKGASAAVPIPDDAEFEAWKAKGGEPAGNLKGFGTAAGEGATLGFADEILGGIDAAGAVLPRWLGGESLPTEKFGDRYRSTRDRIRSVDKQFGEEHPVAHFAGEMAGGLATGGAFGAARRSLASMALEGAGMGAVAGAGNANGGLGDRLEGAALGGAAGGVLGAAIPGAGRVAGRRVRRVADSGAGEALGNLASAGADAVGLRPATNASRGRAARMLGVSSYEDLAKKDVLQELERDNIPVSDAIDQARTTAAAGKPEALTEIGGGNVKGLARQTHDTPGRGGEEIGTFLTTRMEEQPKRVAQDLEDASGAGRQNMEQYAEDLINQRRSSAAPLYSQAFAHGAVDDPKINELLKLPYFQRAWEQAKRLAELDGKKLPEIIRTRQVDEPIIFDGVPLTNPDGTPRMNTRTVNETHEVPTVEALHYLKLGLDDVIHSGQRTPLESGGLGPTVAKKLLGKRDEFLSALDADVPAYAKARAQYNGDSEMMRALDDGRSEFLNSTSDKVAHKFAKLSAGEQDLYRLGAVNAIGEQLSKVKDGRDVTALFQNPLMREKMATILPAGEVDNFLNAIAEEGKFGKSRNFVTEGSRTAPSWARLAKEATAEFGAPALTALAINPWAAIPMYILNRMVRRNLGRAAEERAAARAPFFTSTGEDLAQRLESASSKPAAAAPASSTGKPLLARASEVAAGGTAGSSAAGTTPAYAGEPSQPSMSQMLEQANSGGDVLAHEVQRTGADIPNLRRRKDESSTAFRKRKHDYEDEVRIELGMLLASDSYKGLSDAVRAGHMDPHAAENVRRQLIENKVRATRKAFGSL